MISFKIKYPKKGSEIGLWKWSCLYADQKNLNSVDVTLYFSSLRQTNSDLGADELLPFRTKVSRSAVHLRSRTAFPVLRPLFQTTVDKVNQYFVDIGATPYTGVNRSQIELRIFILKPSVPALYKLVIIYKLWLINRAFRQIIVNSIRIRVD